MVSIDRFEKDDVFICPVCGERISSMGKKITEYVEIVGTHYEKCAKSISKEQLIAVLECKA